MYSTKLRFALSSSIAAALAVFGCTSRQQRIRLIDHDNISARNEVQVTRIDCKPPPDRYSDITLGADGIYWVKILKGELGKVDYLGKNETVLLDSLRSPCAISFGGGYCFVAEAGTRENRNKDGRLLRFDPKSGQTKVLLENLQLPSDIYATPGGDVYYVEARRSASYYGTGADQVCVYEGEIGKPRLITDRLPSPFSITMTADKKLLVGCVDGIFHDDKGNLHDQDFSLFEVDASTGRFKCISRRLPQIFSFTDGGNKRLYVNMYASAGKYVVGELDLQRGYVQVLSECEDAMSIAADTGGRLYCACIGEPTMARPVSQK